MINDAQKYIKIIEDFPVTSLEERDAKQYALTCMRAHVNRKKIDDMIAEVDKVDLILNMPEKNDCRFKTPKEIKAEIIGIIHKYCG